MDRPLAMPGPEKALARDTHGQIECPGENIRDVIRAMFDLVFQKENVQ